jgi:hypothetical protein
MVYDQLFAENCWLLVHGNFALVSLLWGEPAQWGAGQMIPFMLHHFSWQQFLIAASVLTLAWYGFVLMVIYSKGVFARKVGTPVARAAAVYRGDAAAGQPAAGEAAAAAELMGKPAEREGCSRVGSDEFGFAGPASALEAETGFSEDDLLGLIPDVMEELKTVMHRMEETGGTRAEMLDGLRGVIAGHPSVHRHREAISEWIADLSVYELELEELWSLWE